MARKKLKTAVRRSQIAEAALAIVGEAGVRGLSIAKIAKRVGIAPSNVYRHYDSKAEILEAVIDYFGSRIRENVEQAAGADTALERIERAARGHARLMAEVPGIPLVIFSEEVFHGAEGFRAAAVQHLFAYFEALAGFVEDGRTSGEIRKDVDPGRVPVLLLGMVAPAAMVWHASGKAFDLDGQIDFAVDALARALRAETPKRKRKKTG